MPWMRGSLSAPGDASAAGKRMLWETGSEQPLWSPNSDEFWQWTSKYIPDGNMAASRQTSLDTSRVQVRTPAAAHGGKTWSLSIERADEGVLEDWSIQLGKNLTNVLSLTVEDVFGIAD